MPNDWSEPGVCDGLSAASKQMWLSKIYPGNGHVEGLDNDSKT